jgi:LysM repeat protein
MDPKKQANNFIGYVKSMNDNGELPPVLDLEAHDNQSKDKVIATAKTWLDLVEAEFGRKPIIYSGQYFLQDHFSVPGGGPPPWAKDYPLWEAQYPNSYAPGMMPYLPKGWFAWTFWQYSDKGQVNGINAAVDMNVFNGTIDDLFKFAGGTQPIVVDPVKKPTSHKVAAGDTFESIANKYGITLRELIGANAQLLKVGDSLKLPAADQPSAPVVTTPSAKTYTVKSGDTLYAIAIKHGTTVAAIASKNNIANVNVIEVGQVLQIP